MSMNKTCPISSPDLLVDLGGHIDARRSGWTGKIISIPLPIVEDSYFRSWPWALCDTIYSFQSASLNGMERSTLGLNQKREFRLSESTRGASVFTTRVRVLLAASW